MIVKILAICCGLLLLTFLVKRDVGRNDTYNKTKEAEGSSTEESDEENHY